MVDLERIAADPQAFRRALLIETPKGLEPLADCCDPRQAEDFAATDAAVRSLLDSSPVPSEPACFRHWWERGRSGSKTQDMAVVAVNLIAFSRRQLTIIVVAVDAAQARLVADSVGRLVRHNGWLRPICEPTRWQAVNPRTESRLVIETSDTASSYGWLPDALFLDEVSMWPTDAIWQSAMSAAGKRPACLVVCGMNAGYLGSWPHALREKIQTDPAWRFSRWDSPAAWITEATLAEQERFLRPGEFSRLWKNLWIPSLSDALPGDMIERALVHDAALWSPEPPWDVACIGADLGHSNDHSAVVLLAASSTRQKIRVARVLDFPPFTGFDIIEHAIFDLARTWGIRRVCLDQWQAIQMSQNLTARGLTVVPIAATAQSNARQCTTLLSALRDSTLELYPDDDLLQDLRTAQIEEKPSGPRLIFARDDRGHGDRLSAMLHALVSLAETLPFCALEEPEEPTMMHIPTAAGYLPMPMGSVGSVADVERLQDRIEAAVESFGAGAIPREGFPTGDSFFG